jgi:hypothetical protein
VILNVLIELAGRAGSGRKEDKMCTKHETFYVSIETTESGYRVTRQKHFMPKYDTAALIDIKECIDSWIAKIKPGQEMSIDLIGNGTANYFHQVSIIRFIKRQWDSDGYTVVWFGDAQTGEKQEHSNKKDAVKHFNQEYRRVADYIQY